MATTDVSGEARSILYAVRGLRQQTEKLYNSSFPGNHSGPKKWLRIVRGLLDTAEERIEAISKLSRTAPASDPVGNIRQASQATDYAYEALTLCEGATSDDIPYPVVDPLQRFLDKLELKNDFFFRAKQEANYELYPFEDRAFKGIRNQSLSLQRALKSIQWPFTRITVPSRAFSIIPHFAIVAHEIGHALFDKIDWSTVPSPPSFKPALSKVEARLDALKRSGTSITYEKRLLRSYAWKIYGRWFEEVASDAVGFYLMGPAMFFALSEFLLISWSSYGLGDTHPASELRLRLLHNHLSMNGSKSFCDVFQASTNRQLTPDFCCAALVKTPDNDQIFNDMKQIISGDDHILQAAIIAELHPVIEECSAGIYSAVKSHLELKCPEIIYTPEKFERDIAHHADALLYAIPPVEREEAGGRLVPTDFASILNVGWLVLLCKLDELHIGDKDTTQSERVEVLQGLILKGVELSEARRRWVDA